MRNEVIPPNLRNEPMMHHLNLNDMIPQTKHSIRDQFEEEALGVQLDLAPGRGKVLGRLGVGRPLKTDLDDIESNMDEGGYAEGCN
jgi:hypothetical protein